MPRRSSRRRRSTVRRVATAAVALATFAEISPLGTSVEASSGDVPFDASAEDEFAGVPAGSDVLPSEDGPIAAVVRDGDGLSIQTFEPAPAADVDDAVATLAELPGVLAVEEVGTWQLTGIEPGDPYRPLQWQLDSTRALDVPDRDGAGVVVAVLDTGVAPHEDLDGLVLPGWDFVTEQPTTPDPPYHGTFVSGLITSLTNNGVGIAATVDNLRILPVTVCEADSCAWVDVAEGIVWATDQGADVINMSLGGPGLSQVAATAIEYALSKGVIVVASAGNDGDDGNPRIYPAAVPGVIGVGAVAQVAGEDVVTTWASYGDWVDVAAPGQSVVSTTPGDNYGIGSGTSYSAPQVSAAAALARALDPTITAAEVEALLESTARDIGDDGWDPHTGAGTLDLPAFVAAVEAHASAPTTTTTTTPPTTTTTPPPPTSVVSHRPGVVGPSGPVVIDTATGIPVPIATGAPHPERLVAVAQRRDGTGTWAVDPEGNMYVTGSVPYHGGVGHLPLIKPILGMTPTASGNGYWMVASDGGIFAFGDAGFYGSLGGQPLEYPVIGMITSPTGLGYWLIDAAGRSYAFGDAR